MVMKVEIEKSMAVIRDQMRAYRNHPAQALSTGEAWSLSDEGIDIQTKLFAFSMSHAGAETEDLCTAVMLVVSNAIANMLNSTSEDPEVVHHNLHAFVDQLGRQLHDTLGKVDGVMTAEVIYKEVGDA